MLFLLSSSTFQAVFVTSPSGCPAVALNFVDPNQVINLPAGPSFSQFLLSSRAYRRPLCWLYPFNGYYLCLPFFLFFLSCLVFFFHFLTQTGFFPYSLEKVHGADLVKAFVQTSVFLWLNCSNLFFGALYCRPCLCHLHTRSCWEVRFLVLLFWPF